MMNAPENTAEKPTTLEGWRERAETLERELRRREGDTMYEVRFWGQGAWQRSIRTPSREHAKSEAQELSASRLSSPIADDAYVIVIGEERVFDNTDLVNERRMARRSTSA